MTANKSACSLSALRDTSSVRSPSTVPSSSSASRHRRALALSNQTTSKPAEADLSVASETLWTGLPSLTSRALTLLRSVVSQMTGGSRASDASHECASSHKEPTLTQNLPRRASGVSTPGIAKQIRGAPPGVAPAYVLTVHSAAFRFASRSLLALLTNGLTIPFGPSRTPSCTLWDFLRRWDCRRAILV